jgi:elongator complex protein 3
MNLHEQIIKYLLKNPPHTEKDILAVKRKFCKLSDTADAPTNAELLAEYKKLKINKPDLLKLLRKRQVRTLSGIAPIAVLTKPYVCPGNCAYCPSEQQMPKSYLSNEPAVMRAILCKFDPYQQVQLRLRALTNNGHSTDKLELIVMGGTWSYLPKKYQIWFIKECFRAANEFSYNKKSVGTQNLAFLQKELQKQQKKNESAKNRIIGLTLETRPDFINPKELWKMRQLGCTRIEIGVQHIDNQILKLNRRGHNVATTIQATQLMRSFGFKITYHLMLNLPGSTPRKDFKMMQTIFSEPRFQPDQIKIYPTVVAQGALIHKWYKQNKWQPYSTRQLINLLIKIKSITPPWVRIIRVIRDIPEESIIAGNKITNLRQLIKAQMSKKKIICQCIRCREAGRQSTINNQQLTIKNIKLITRKYKLINGTEYFLSFESANKKILYAFCRLFLPSPSCHCEEPRRNVGATWQSRSKTNQLSKSLSDLNNAAIIRELHTYGSMVPLNQKGNIQHQGLGKKLLAQAEYMARQNNYKKISIISGIGVRNYYRGLGYQLKNTYLIKKI